MKAAMSIDTAAKRGAGLKSSLDLVNRGSQLKINRKNYLIAFMILHEPTTLVSSLAAAKNPSQS